MANSPPKKPRKPERAKPPRKTGRPPTWTPERIAATIPLICEKIANREPVHQFAGKDGMPSESVIYEWLAENPAFAERYAHARERAGHRYAFAALEVADNVGKIVMDKDADGNPVPVVLGPDVARIKIDTLKWAAGKFASRLYGDKVTQEITGKDGKDLDAPIIYLPDNGRGS
jgi:hypothetical protein